MRVNLQLAPPAPALSPLASVGRLLRTIVTQRRSRRTGTAIADPVDIDPVTDRATIRKTLSKQLPPHLLKDVGGGDG